MVSWDQNRSEYTGQGKMDMDKGQMTTLTIVE